MGLLKCAETLDLSCRVPVHLHRVSLKSNTVPSLRSKLVRHYLVDFYLIRRPLASVETIISLLNPIMKGLALT